MLAPLPLQRMLFSATLTSNPQKLSALKLKNPKFYSMAQATAAGQRNGTAESVEKMALPAELSEFSAVVGTSGVKPLLLVALLRRLSEQFVIVFTSSVDSTHRLSRLLELIGGFRGRGVAEFSGSLSRQQRNDLMAACARDEVNVLVCSDGGTPSSKPC